MLLIIKKVVVHKKCGWCSMISWSFLWGFCISIFSLLVTWKKPYRLIVFLTLLCSDYRTAVTLEKGIHFCSYPIVTAEIESFLWGFCKWNLFYHVTKWYYRNLTEMYLFLLLPYRDNKIAETLQKQIHFCSYPLVTAEIKSFLCCFCRSIFYRNLAEMVLILLLLYSDYRSTAIIKWLQKCRNLTEMNSFL